MANQNQYSGWNSKAEAASLDKWVKAAHLEDTIRRIRNKELDYAAKVVYFKKELSKLRCFSFSQTRRFPIVWDAVNISKGEIKSNLDKVAELADKISAVNDCGLDLWHLQHNDAFLAFDAAFDALDAILNEAFEYNITRDELENKLGITWKRGPRRT